MWVTCEVTDPWNFLHAGPHTHILHIVSFIVHGEFNPDFFNVFHYSYVIYYIYPLNEMKGIRKRDGGVGGMFLYMHTKCWIIIHHSEKQTPRTSFMTCLVEQTRRPDFFFTPMWDICIEQKGVLWSLWAPPFPTGRRV